MEYAKAHARAHRYTEEEELVVEEMLRTLRYLKWKCSWWLSRDSTHEVEGIASGKKAYAAKQASQLNALATKFKNLWQPLLKDLAIQIDSC